MSRAEAPPPGAMGSRVQPFRSGGRPRVLEGDGDGAGVRVAVVVSRFNSEVTDRLLHGALAELDRLHVRAEDVAVIAVPGAFEIPTAALAAARSGRHDAVVCVGAVVRGETPHFDYVAGETARGIAEVARATGIPILFGVVTTDTLEQALARAGGSAGNKGTESAQGAVEMARLLTAVRADTVRAEATRAETTRDATPAGRGR
jgi:6,7-dimethyl-8-ribityllumazine synthase